MYITHDRYGWIAYLKILVAKKLIKKGSRSTNFRDQILMVLISRKKYLNQSCFMYNVHALYNVQCTW